MRYEKRIVESFGILGYTVKEMAAVQHSHKNVLLVAHKRVYDARK